MTLTMAQGIELQNLLGRLRNEKISIKTAYKFNKVVDILEKELNFYNKQLSKIIDKYALKDENGQPVLSEDKTSIQIKEDKIEDCQREMNELSTITFDINDISFTLEELGNINLTILETRILMPLIKE